jgi:hypothetical protein
METEIDEKTAPRWRIHLILGIAVLMMLTPSFLYLAGPLRSPMVVEGDRLGQHDCPACNASTKSDCTRCGNKRQVLHVFPGPNRPTQVVGHVYSPDQAVIPQAQVTIDSAAGKIEVKTDEQGRFGATLPPGHYPLSIKSDKLSYSADLEVPKLTNPLPVDQELGFSLDHRPFVLK